MTERFTEFTVEDAALAWLENAGCWVAYGPDIAAPCLPARQAAQLIERLQAFQLAETEGCNQPTTKVTISRCQRRASIPALPPIG
jgi:hypothetical protein